MEPENTLQIWQRPGNSQRDCSRKVLFYQSINSLNADFSTLIGKQFPCHCSSVNYIVKTVTYLLSTLFQQKINTV